jgi:hypothetical protein
MAAGRGALGTFVQVGRLSERERKLLCAFHSPLSIVDFGSLVLPLFFVDTLSSRLTRHET